MTAESYGRIFLGERNTYPEATPNQRKDSHV